MCGREEETLSLLCVCAWLFERTNQIAQREVAYATKRWLT